MNSGILRIITIFSIVYLTVSTTGSGLLYGQDPILTQSQMVPIYYNPASTGAFDGTYRVGLHYRDQWRGFLEEPITTWSVYGDFSFPAPFASLKSRDRIGAGIQFNADRVGVFDFNTNQINLNLAYHKSLDPKRNEYLSLGLQFGVLQRSVNYSNLTFGDEFNGIDDYTQITGEPLPPNILAVADIGLGLHYSVNLPGKDQFFAGVSMLHLGSPNISFYERDDLLEPRYDSDYSLPVRYGFQAGLRTSLSKLVHLTPRFNGVWQGPFGFYQLGATTRAEITQSRASAFHLGAWINGANQQTGFTVLSTTLMTGFEVRSLLLSFSYDVLLSNVQSSARWRNSFEFSLRYIGKAENTDNFCPEF